MRDWVTNVATTHYLIGSAIGPHPFPTIVRDFQSIIGIEARAQILHDVGRLPDVVVACVGGGSNAIGMFHAFVPDKSVKLIGVEAGGDQTLRAAIDEALRDWVSDPNGTFYLLGSAVGPHPYPYLVRELQSIIGREAREQFLKREGRLPDAVFACVGGGSNAIGMFHAFVADRDVAIIGIEAGGRGSALGQNAASLSYGWPGVLQGCYSLLLQDENGQIYETDSISAGLDYPGVGPEHALLLAAGRVQYESATDEEALDALQECARMEGILPALETAHALHGAKRWAALNPGKHLLLNMSGRGDKDMPTLQRTLLDGKRSGVHSQEVAR